MSDPSGTPSITVQENAACSTVIPSSQNVNVVSVLGITNANYANATATKRLRLDDTESYDDSMSWNVMMKRRKSFSHL